MKEEWKPHLYRLAQVIVNLDYKKVDGIVKKALDVGVPAHVMVLEGLARGMGVVGGKYEKGEYFLAELIMASEVFKEAMKLIEPSIRTEKVAGAGVVVMGTVSGDLHDIGKNIVIAMLRSAGFTVYDLGMDVPTEKFVEKVKELKPDILAMSSLLLSTRPEMRKVIEALKTEGLRHRVRIMVGGRPVTSDYAREIGADAYAHDCVEAVKVAKRLITNPTT